MMHIIERTLTHLFWDPGFILALTFLLRYLARKTKWRWMPQKLMPTICWAGAITLPFALAREPFDIQMGGWIAKSYIDMIGHFIIIPLGCWALYRLIQWGIEDSRR